MQTNELREKYLSFFETKGCVRRPSDVLAPKWDPSVLFTPAGMNQFKDHFLRRCKLEFMRATTCQKCLRTGDIDNVGRTAYHHTFFEMLGNFSFGDYFKKEAIAWAWEFLTDKKWLNISKEKLSVTVYQDDAEAAELWLKMIGVPKERLTYCGEEDNFWPASAPSQGPDGVCGPCSEIYYDTPLGTVEIWNLVFTQFERHGNPPDNLSPLPSKNIDTGMGLERCAAVLQNVETNYHIDILRPLVEESAAVCGQKYKPDDESGRRFRRIADHIRACTFAVHENVYPGNKEERYVIRRLLRRAVLDGWQLGVKKPFLYLLVPKVAELMRTSYPELSETMERVAKVIGAEEEHFLGTIDGGLSKITKIFKSVDQEKNAKVSGKDAFEMYQTFGFPPELFETMASEQNIGFDWNGFHKEMERHGEISSSAEKNLLFKQDPFESIKKQYQRTEFVGYEKTKCEAKVIAILVDGKLVNEASKGQTVHIVLDKTPFYGEKGGQIGDRGVIFPDDGGVYDMRIPSLWSEINVESTQLDGDLIVHIGTIGKDCPNISVGDTVSAGIDQFHRKAISRAHTATHLLHFVLRMNLGNHAEQQGSKVDADLLRFDFTNHSAIDKATLAKIEREVNELVLDAYEGNIEETTIEEARKTGAMMLFGEKYPEKVRVVRFGDSIELCGGTHLSNTSEVGFFKMISEESVSAGTRRITALTGLKAMEKALADCATLQTLASALKISTDALVEKVNDLTEQTKKLRKRLETQSKQEKFSADDAIAQAETIGGIKFVTATIKDAKPNDLRGWVDQIRQKISPAIVILASLQEDDKVALIVGLNNDLVAAKKFDAVTLIKTAASAIGGSGGGRPDMAQAGGKGHNKITEAFALGKNWLEEKMKEF
ncbi:MAG: alanine--tRNA ligase [Planctomycetaceae bacterium]|jgi:alanyl-tRNA synthetase|nr:alanine--tRNA ligase [Planctomycetaceae bacterium]